LFFAVQEKNYEFAKNLQAAGLPVPAYLKDQLSTCTKARLVLKDEITRLKENMEAECKAAVSRAVQERDESILRLIQDSDEREKCLQHDFEIELNRLKHDTDLREKRFQQQVDDLSLLVEEGERRETFLQEKLEELKRLIDDGDRREVGLQQMIDEYFQLSLAKDAEHRLELAQKDELHAELVARYNNERDVLLKRGTSAEEAVELKQEFQLWLNMHGLTRVDHSYGDVNFPLQYIVYDERALLGPNRVIKIFCPGLSETDIELLIPSTSQDRCTVAVNMPEADGKEVRTFSRLFHFKISESVLEFSEEQMQYEQGVLTLVFLIRPEHVPN